jgi:hypothetical protein
MTRDALRRQPMTIPRRRIERALLQIQSQFIEHAGLSLTAADAQRRCGVSRRLSQAVLDALAGAGVLVAQPDGAYQQRVPKGEEPRAAAA